ncbi:transposase [Cronobacter dublinensis]|nr:transposase [Cronobacter dublinensis]
MKKRFADEPVISILREAEAGVSARELYHKYAIPDTTFYIWSKKYGGMEVSMVWSCGLSSQISRRRMDLLRVSTVAFGMNA